MKKMKNMKFAVLAVIFLMAVLVACKKNNDTLNPIDAIIEAPKVNGIAKNEAVVFSFTSYKSTETTSWSVTPNNNVNITANGNTATIKFGYEGMYTVSARAGSHLANTVVTVDSTSGPSCGVIAFPTSDTIAITPSVVDSAGLKKLKLVVSGSTFYPNACYTLVSNTNGSVINQLYNIQITGVNKPYDSSSCAQALTRAKSEQSLIFTSNGVAAFSVKLNNNLKYEGNIKRDTAVGEAIRFTFTRTGSAAGANVFPTVVQ